MSRILALDVGGTPRRWVSVRTAVGYQLDGSVIWSLGNSVATWRSTRQECGRQTVVHTPSIIAVSGRHFDTGKFSRVTLNNRTLFGRDRNMCCYCGRVYDGIGRLSRDHITPRSRGGSDTWMNCVTSCLDCNTYKGARTPEEVGLKMLYLPYVPNHYEHMILQNRNILGDQMEYLLGGLSRNSRILQKHNLNSVFSQNV